MIAQLIIIFLTFCPLLTIGQEVIGVRAASVNATRLTLDRILRTYEWDQYRFQAAACVNTATLGVDCSKVYYGTNIPSIYSVSVQDYRPQFGQTYLYSYTTLDFYGFGFTNYTQIEPKMINITAQAMYFSCQANSTCAKAYNTTAGIQTSLRNLVAQNSGKIKALLPSNNTKTWVPSSAYANFLSYFTTFPDPSTEVFGTHNTVTFAAQRNLTQAQLVAMYALKTRLSGGAQMWESFMNTMALLSLDPYGNTTTYTRRDSEPNILGGANAFSNLKTQREKLLKDFEILRGTARSRMSELNMASNYIALGLQPESSHGALERRDSCSNSARIAQIISQIQNFASTACGLTAPLRGIFTPFKPTSVGSANSPYYQAAVQLQDVAKYTFNHFLAYLSFADSMCNLLAGNQPCYPDPNLWISSASTQNDLESLAIDCLDLAEVVAGGPVPSTLALINIGCDIVAVAQDTYGKAAKCCAANCNSPSCTAGGASCAGASSGGGC